jgi:acyl-CoA synthetase (AMP-forming)/AMP-acid ligase II
MPGLELKIVDSEDMAVDLPHDGEAQGELLARGPWITGAYYNLSSEEQQGKFYDGWLVTGDIASIDVEGYLIIRDRSKDLIKSGGEWISSVDLENAISAIPGVAMTCVVGMPHPRWDERPVAIVVMQDGVPPISKAQVDEHLLNVSGRP